MTENNPYMAVHRLILVTAVAFYAAVSVEATHLAVGGFNLKVFGDTKFKSQPLATHVYIDQGYKPQTLCKVIENYVT